MSAATEEGRVGEPNRISADTLLGRRVRELVESGANVSIAGPRCADTEGRTIPTGYAVACWDAAPANGVHLRSEPVVYPTLDEAVRMATP